MSTSTVEGFRLSPSQRRLWQLQEAAGGVVYPALAVVAIDGELDPRALRTALQRAVERNEVLRTGFQQLPEMSLPLQVVRDEATVEMETHELSGLSETARREEIEAIGFGLENARFDLERDPLLRARLAASAPDRHVLYLALPALCGDSAGLTNLVREIADRYAEVKDGRKLTDDEEPVQYIDLSEWQNDLLEAEETRAGREYWARQDVSALLDGRLPWELHPSAAGAFDPRSLPRRSMDQGNAVEKLAARLEMPAETVLLAGWAVLLRRLGMPQDVLIGVRCSGRRYSELETALGLFERCLPLVVPVDLGASFAETARGVAVSLEDLHRFQESFTWENLPGLDLEDDVPSIPFGFAFEEPPGSIAGAGLSFNVHTRRSLTERFGVRLSWQQGADGSIRELDYDATRYRGTDVERLDGYLETLMTSAAEALHEPVGRLDLLSQAERARWLFELNDAASTEGKADRAQAGRCVHELFFEQVAQHPDRPALACDGEELTYAELGAEVSRLAHYLAGLGVGPELGVALCLGRSTRWVKAMLGVSLAGGYYVPLDPTLPRERMASVLAESGVRWVLCEPATASSLPPDGPKTVDLVAEAEALQRCGTEPPKNVSAPENLIYGLLTSGSSGRPKAVAVEHRQLVSYLLAVADRLDLSVPASYATVSTLAADLGNTMIFPALCLGGTLHLVDEARVTDPEALADYMHEHAVDCLKLVPSHLAALLSGARPQQVLPRQRLVLGGEALRWELIDQISRLDPTCTVFNHYGPTETTVGVLTHRVGGPAEGSATVPLGRSLPNARAYLLDAWAVPVPAGVPGELSFGGRAVSRGYLGRPGLTAGSFLPDSSAGEPGARRYRTGDLARHLEDGSLEFIGRIDHQVKIRGFRIELGEIETALAAHPDVQAAVVIAPELGGDRRLVAYAVPRDGRTLTDRSLGDWLRARLPEHMVPAQTVLLRSLPLTANGKVDRRALPEPEEASSTEGGDYSAPSTATEEIVAGIWSELLGVDRVGVDDSFFRLGGHSLLATQVISRLRSAFGISPGLATFFEQPTVAGLAASIEAEMRAGAGFELSAIPSLDRDGVLPMSYAQERYWFLNQLIPQPEAYNIRVFAALAGCLDLAALSSSLDAVVRRHEVLRTTLREIDGRPAQWIAPPLHVPLPQVDLTRLPAFHREAETERLGVSELKRPFDVAADPMLRALLVRSGETDHALLVTTHHVAFDGSLDVFAREVASLYSAFVTGEPSPLPEPAVQYADFASWQRQWLEGGVLEAQIGYWKQQLAGAPAMLSLPTDRPRPSLQTFRGGRRRFELSGELIEALKAIGRRQDATLFMTVLAAFQALLGRYAEQDDVLVGSPIADRPHPQTEGLIGCFVNTVVLRARLDGEASFRALLEQVKSTALDAYLHKELPFEVFVEAFQPERALSHSPLFQVMFVLRGAASQSEAQSLALPGLDFRILPFERETSRFDLLVNVAETGDGGIGAVEYNSDLFDASTVDRMMSHLASLLHGVAENPDSSLASQPMLSAAERHQALFEWNATSTPLLDRRLAHQGFERWAAEVPGAVAVVGADGELTYGELEGRANRLARHLASLGIGPGALVGVHLDRSPDTVVALLGILKAGGAYVPLDPRYPRQRVLWILGKLDVTCLITSRRRLAALAGEDGADDWSSEARELRHLVFLGEEVSSENRGPLRLWGPADLENHSPTAPELRACPDDVAYIIFTSGSTGTPKGVVVRHRPVVNLIDWVNETFEVGPADRVLQVTSLSFDLSVYDVFGLLAAGGSLRLPSDEEAQDPARLADILAEEPITFWNSAPAALQHVASSFPSSPAAEGRLRRVFLSGDWVPLALPGQVWRRFPEARVVALGGATEATVWSNFQRVHSVPREWVSVPYGRPIRNARYYTLDNRLEPCPLGVAGDLFIGGGCLAAGYALQPALTARSFIPDPFARVPGVPMYRTGDRVRVWRDGTMEFLGRLDHQVKIRGFRVELGEVETVLVSHPAIQTAVVLAPREGTEHRRLVAYLVPAQGAHARLTFSELRSFAGERLPDYMVPAASVWLDALPMTANGKLDRDALPDPFSERFEQGARVEAPRSQGEEIVAGAMAEVLGLAQLGAGENFFEIGGHSLLATQLVSRLRQAFEVDLELRNVFEAPTVRELTRRIEAARAESSAVPLAPIEREEGGAAPLAFAQERMWFLHQLQPDSPAYNIAGTFRLSGDLDREALESALTTIVQRHEALRTGFTATGGEPAQVIVAEASMTVPWVDLRNLPGAQREAAFLSLAAAHARKPFDLAQPPLLQVTAVRLGAEAHGLLLRLHHIVSDAWSVGILLREVAALYQPEKASREVSLPPLPIQYVDYARWQRAWMRGEVLEQQLAFWRGELESLPVLELPSDRLRPPIQSSAGASERVMIDSEVTDSLAALGRARGATLFMVTLTAFQALLTRLSGQSDVAVGSPVANRGRPEVEDLIGLFLNTLVLRCELTPDLRFEDGLARVRGKVLQAYEHQDLPFEKLVGALQPERSLSHSPLFQVMFMFQAAAGELRLSDAELEWVQGESTTSRFDWTLSLTATPHGLGGWLEYSTDLFDRTTIQRSLSQLRSLLEGIAAAPSRALSQLPLLASAERHQLLAEWNDTRRVAPDACIHRLVEAQAARTPGQPALRYGTIELSYSELVERSRRLSAHLRRAGVGREERVGVLLERSPEMLVALLGILGAGAAYVPLDPAYPSDRLAFMLRDSGARLLVTEGGLADSLPAVMDHVVDVKEVCSARATITAADAGDPGAHPEQLAYVIYTSGSTGRPKGVQISHRAWANFLAAMESELAFGPSDVLLAVTSLSFDIAGLELFLPLTTGARVALASRQEAMDGERLLKLLSRTGATVMQATPATWRLLLAAGWDGDPPLKVLCGGEAMPSELAAALRRRSKVVWNLYGPTETTIWSATHRLAQRDGGPVAIGRPIANTDVHVLDHALEPAPLGVAGELYIGGAGLTRGYLGRPSLTAEKLVPDPLSTDGVRLYRTGDLVRRRTDGSLEFIARIDHQIKLRGFRIELGEIEAALSRQVSVAQAAAVLWSPEGGEPQLVAYVAPADGGSVASVPELRAHLAESLPEYMLPSVFVTLGALPLTPNGKVDRRALPAPTAQTTGAAEPPIGAVTAVVEVLAGIWAEVLGRERVDAGESFFVLGGHSLLATQAISRVREAFSVEIPLRSLFEHPTPAGLARRVEEMQQADQGVAAPPIVRVSREGELPLSFAQQRLWVVDQLEPGNPAFNIPAAVRLTGELDVAALRRTFHEIVTRHEVLRTSFPDSLGRPRQVVSEPRLALPMVDLSGIEPTQRRRELSRLVVREARRPFDLSVGPLLRLTLIREAPSEHAVLFTLHHIVSDAWSRGVLIREVAAIYGALVAGRPSPLPALALQYADFARWQRDWLRGEVLQAQLAFWQKMLAGAPPVLELPTDRPRPSARTFRGGKRPVALPRQLTADLVTLGRRSGSTLFMVVLAGFQTVLRSLTGRDDVVVGTDVANRNRSEIEPLIGFFVNQLPLRVDLSGDPSFEDLLRRVREVSLGAYAHQDLPFEQLVAALDLERTPNVEPVFQVKLFFQNTPNSELELPGLRVEPLEIDGDSVKLDLEIALWETPDGLRGAAKYSLDLFEPATIDGFLNRLTQCLELAAARPGIRLDELDDAFSKREKEQRAMQQAQRKKIGFSKLKAVKPKAVSLPQTEVVKRGYLEPGQTLPLVIEPTMPDVDLADWATNHRERIEKDLFEHGAILFRGFGLDTPPRFERFALSICSELFNENGEHPRESVSGNVYTPVFYPPEKQLLWHNENSFNHTWPKKIMFGCATEPEEGGETPIVDSRKVYEALDPELRQRWAEKQVQYMRNYGEGLGLDWPTVFRTSDKAKVEESCRGSRMECEWRGDHLCTRALRPAVIRHPDTGELSWFNQAQHWHISCLDEETRSSLQSLFSEEDLPRNAYYGDGSPIAEEDMQAILDVYRDLEVSFRWQRGDVLLVDNILAAHGRNPFSGQRKILVALGELTSFDEV